MIKDIFKPIDEPSKQTVELVQELIESDALMAGLGKNCEQYPVPPDIPVITDVDRAIYLLRSQEMWDEPEETRQDQFFQEVQNGGVDPYIRYEGEDLEQRRVILYDSFNNLDAYLTPVIEGIIKKHQILDYQLTLHAKDRKKNKKMVADIVEYIYADMAWTFISTIITAGFHGGVETWPIAHHFYKCLQTGGLPVGWVGALPQDGGEPHKCVQLLHFGPQVQS